MKSWVALGVLGALIGALVAPDVALADDCSGLADCFATVQSAIAALLGGGLVLAATAAFLSGSGRGSTGERAGTGAASAASAPPEAPRPSEPGLPPRETTPPSRTETKLYPPGGGPPERISDERTEEGDQIHWNLRPDGSGSGSLTLPDGGGRVDASRRADGSQTQWHYGPDGQLIGTKEIAPDQSYTNTTPPVTNPDGSVSQSKTDHAPDGTLIDSETNTAYKDGTTSSNTTMPDGSSTSQTNYPDRTTSTTVRQPDGATTERTFNADGRLTSETTTSSPGSSHFDKL